MRRSSLTRQLGEQLLTSTSEDRESLCKQLYRVAGASGEARRVFLALLEDRDANIRACAAMYLGSIGGRGVQRALLVALSDQDRVVRSCAVHSLGLVGSIAVGRRLEAVVADAGESPKVRGDALEALATLPFRKASKTIVAALYDDEPEVRFFAANAIANLDIFDALPVLRAVERTERAKVPGFGSVRQEMRAAIEHLERRRHVASGSTRRT